MNTQDVTRSVIRLELSRAFRGMESNPKRTLRKLADLGKVCARGSVQKEIFGIFQQCLRYKDSPYFSVMQNLVRNVSAENLTTFGMTSVTTVGRTVQKKSVQKRIMKAS